jgi:hypothetical protein
VSPSPLTPCQYILFSMLRPSMKVDAHFCGASRQKAFACPQRAYIIHILSIRSVERCAASSNPRVDAPKREPLRATQSIFSNRCASGTLPLSVAARVEALTSTPTEMCRLESRDWRFGTQRASEQMQAERENKAAQPFAVCQENEQMH